jgi:hypothetical protein
MQSKAPLRLPRVKSPYRTVHIYDVYLSPDDVADISATLIAAFPRMIFRVYDWNKHGERMYPGLARSALTEARRVSRLPEALRPAKYHFASHLTDYPEQFKIHGLLPPEDWRPIWTRSSGGSWVALNQPPFGFSLTRPSYYNVNTGWASYLPVWPGPEDTEIHLRSGWFQSGYRVSDPAHVRFARKCKRLFLKHTIRRFCHVDSRSGEIIRRSDGGHIHVGFHALEWARQHPRNFVDSSIKPYDWQPPR